MGTATATGNWDGAGKVLCVRLDTLGDVLMTTPAIRALKQARPGRQVTLLTSPSGAKAAALVPEIDRVLVYEAPWMKATPPRADCAHETRMIKTLQAAQFDAAAVFTVFSQNPLPAALMCYLAGIPRRLAHCHENPYQLLTTWVADPEPKEFIRHEVRRQLDLVAAVGCRTEDERLSLRVCSQTIGHVRSMLAERGIGPATRWLVMHPGASAPSRRYPPESFAAVARALACEHGCRIVLTGGPDERELVEAVGREMGAPSDSLAGLLDLPHLAALIAEAPLLISNNTGPVHVAAAVGTPVVDVYAQTNPQHTPWAVPHRVVSRDVPCKNCFKSVCPEGHHDCLRRIEPETVVRAALELMPISYSSRSA